MKLNWKLIATIAMVQITLAAFAVDDADLAALKKQLQELDMKVRMLEHQQDTAATTAKTAPMVSLGANGFSFSSADSNFVAQLHGLVQVDSRSFFNDGKVNGNDGFLLRKARPIFSGTVFRDFDFMFMPEFGGSTVQIMDAYVNYRYNPAFQVQVGKFKSPVGLENLQGDPNITFNERSIANNLIPNRDLGIMIKGDLFGGAASYAVGIFDGAPDYSATTFNAPLQDGKAVAGRVFFQPWKNTKVKALKGLGFGVGGSYEWELPQTNTATGLTPGYLTDGQQKFFSYKTSAFAESAHWRLSPQLYYYYGPFGLLGEYVISDQGMRSGATDAEIQNTGWELTASWLLTGETATYGAVTPKKPFDPRKGQWGALQLVARYGELSVDGKAFSTFADATKSAPEARAISGGLNWYLNKNIRANLSYSYTAFSGYQGSAAGVGRQPENVLFSRVQFAF
jgi:phosphate-selective porin OprO/OprP